MKRAVTLPEVNEGEYVCEVERGPDNLGRYSFTLYWWADYRVGLQGPGVRAQCFFANPDEYCDKALEAGLNVYQIDARSGRRGERRPYQGSRAYHARMASLADLAAEEAVSWA